ncbi:MAG TPA: hypothetical protein VKE40_24845 [Gemmataceae bacterium]|nr:hypothetical protein [Gemmataceae bacterium]
MKQLIALMLCLMAPGWIAAAPKVKDQFATLDVQPAPAPTPAMRYALLPEVAEMNPGNAVPAYLKSFAEQYRFFFLKESSDERERLLKCPLTDIKPGQLKEYGGHALRQADHAARLEYADWNILPQLREQGPMLLLPEVQQLRALADTLAVRGRGQLVDRDFEGAIGTLKTIFALARHMGDHPTLLTGLVGTAIAQKGLNLLEEYVQQSDAPNLYWALTDLPSPLVETRKAASADRLMLDVLLGPHSDPKRVWTQEELPAVLKKATEVGTMLTEMTPDERQAADAWAKERLTDEAWLADSRKYLTSRGYPEDAVAKYPAAQVLYFKLFAQARASHDEALKWINVPYWEAEPAYLELEKAPPGIEAKLGRSTAFSIGVVRRAHVRLAQRLALLRAVEAIRLDAARNGGKLPASLSDLSVPVPPDPATGKPFSYKLEGITAMLEAKPITVRDGTTTHYRYEVRLRK